MQFTSGWAKTLDSRPKAKIRIKGLGLNQSKVMLVKMILLHF